MGNVDLEISPASLIVGGNNNGDDMSELIGNSQETFTQHELSQNNLELTQLGLDDEKSPQELCASPTPMDPLTVPWGRLMKVGSANSDLYQCGSTVNFYNTSSGAFEMTPRPPTISGSIATRSRSPSMMSEKFGLDTSEQSSIQFLGLKNLEPSDKFNEYVVGRSIKADITVEKLKIPTVGSEEKPQECQIAIMKQKQHDYAHASISNRHCRIYCLLQLPMHSNSLTATTPAMEVFVEDTSGNGTLINGTILLRKNERRKLHTGDVICLVNPKMLVKKTSSMSETKKYVSHYSYVFVNLYEQEARHTWGVGLGKMSDVSPLKSPSSIRKGGIPVNVRETKCHSINSRGMNGNIYRKRNFFQEKDEKSEGKTLPTDELTSGSIACSSHSHLYSNHRRIEEEYDLRDLLGKGTCGEVRRAIHRRTGDERAVKIIDINDRGVGTGFSTEKLLAINAEADILRSLDHPYVVKLFDVIISPSKTIYLVMELIEGGDLFDRIVRRGRYDETQSRRLFRRLLAAVFYLHEERGIVHRDLKPENILVLDRQSDVFIKISDFGVAKNITADGLKTFCGTPQYFAPEVLSRHNTVKGAGRYGKEIDCWSIGVILFILLSGSPPFDASVGFDAVASARIIFYEDQWGNISHEAKDLVKRLLEKDPTKRISIINACEHEWILKDDGDTHTHPLLDPLITTKISPNFPTIELLTNTENNCSKSVRYQSDATVKSPRALSSSPKYSIQSLPAVDVPSSSLIQGKNNWPSLSPVKYRKSSKRNIDSINNAGISMPRPVLCQLNNQQIAKKKDISNYFCKSIQNNKRKNTESQKTNQHLLTTFDQKKHKSDSSNPAPSVIEPSVFSFKTNVKNVIKDRQSEKYVSPESREDRETVPLLIKTNTAENDLQDSTVLMRNMCEDNMGNAVFNEICHDSADDTMMNSNCHVPKNSALHEIVRKKLHTAGKGQAQLGLPHKPPLIVNDDHFEQEACLDDLLLESNTDSKLSVMKSKKTNDINCNPSSEPNNYGSKCGQKSIKNWFFPKK